MRLIDADELERKLMRSDVVHKHVSEDALYIVLSAIDIAPSIDIVRCRECRKANTENCSHSYWDDDWGKWRIGYKGDDWFCADGERSE